MQVGRRGTATSAWSVSIEFGEMSDCWWIHLIVFGPVLSDLWEKEQNESTQVVLLLENVHAIKMPANSKAKLAGVSIPQVLPLESLWQGGF